MNAVRWSVEFEYLDTNEIACWGAVRVLQKHDEFWGEGTDFLSQELHNPTWEDLFKEANNQVICTGDRNHIFFEGFDIVSEAYGKKWVHLLMGS